MNKVFFLMAIGCFAPALVGISDLVFWFWTDHHLSNISWDSSRGAFAYFSSMAGVASLLIARRLTD